jgi:hypothetical protein
MIATYEKQNGRAPVRNPAVVVSCGAWPQCVAYGSAIAV